MGALVLVVTFVHAIRWRFVGRATCPGATCRARRGSRRFARGVLFFYSRPVFKRMAKREKNLFGEFFTACRGALLTPFAR